jgi:hypothetical protein
LNERMSDGSFRLKYVRPKDLKVEFIATDGSGHSVPISVTATPTGVHIYGNRILDSEEPTTKGTE